MTRQILRRGQRAAQARMTSTSACLTLAALLALAGGPAAAQNLSSSGGSWGTSWGFNSASDRSVQLQFAQAMLQARNAGVPGTIQYITNDNRQNYMENFVGEGGTATSDFMIGDEIGQNTNSIGSMNTGTTNIDITGSGNSVSATNRSDNLGCVDGSINTNSVTPSGLTTSFGIDISVSATGHSSSCD